MPSRRMVLLALCTLSPTRAPAQVTLSSLLEETSDLERLTRFPSPPYITRQSSSYDRASKTPTDAAGWFANDDRGQYSKTIERSGRKEKVLLEADGPGAVVRIWSANPEGVLRIYIDGAEEPALQAPMPELLQGKVPPFLPPLAHEVARGTNLYFPFLYARKVLVTTDGGSIYYHVTYRTYPGGTPVEPYSKVALEKAGGGIAAAREALEQWAAPRGGSARSLDVRLSSLSGETASLEAREGGSIIRELVLEPSTTDPAALRGTILVATFDGEETVSAPLGDFFGTGPGLNAYSSLPLAVSAEGRLTCRWPMPYRRTARFELRKVSGPGVDAAGRIMEEPRRWDDASLLFHARWRAAEMATEPPRDWKLLSVSGRGVYAGNVFNVANPVRAWWGEGDEKIYVDDEAFPGHFGTGTEDYYGYAWCSPDRFSHPYHNQTRCDGPANFGHTSVNRWHVLDAIPFTKSFRFDLEIWHWNRSVRLHCSSVSYWYARPEATDDAVLPSAGDLAIPALPERTVLAAKGAIEGESLPIVEKKGEAGPQDMSAFEGGSWSREAQLWWRGANPGDRLVLRFDAARAGRYRVIVRTTRAPDYGIHQIRVNGKDAGGPIDFHDGRVVAAEARDIGAFDLAAEGNRLEVEIAGTNPGARPKNYMFGLDYIVLEPVTD